MSLAIAAKTHGSKTWGRSGPTSRKWESPHVRQGQVMLPGAARRRCQPGATKQGVRGGRNALQERGHSRDSAMAAARERAAR